MNNSILYCCYSKPLKDYLNQNGLAYEIKGKNPTTDKVFWVYIRNEKLNSLLEMWSLGKNS